jgi:murein L,D-transpeptidase YafK
MPCTYDDSYAQEQRAIAVKKNLDRLVRVACTVHQLLETKHPTIFKSLPKENLEWWADHKKSDLKRRAKAKQEKIDRLKELEAEQKELTKKIAQEQKELARKIVQAKKKLSDHGV